MLTDVANTIANDWIYFDIVQCDNNRHRVVFFFPIVLFVVVLDRTIALNETSVQPAICSACRSSDENPTCHFSQLQPPYFSTNLVNPLLLNKPDHPH